MVSGWPIKYASANAVENELIYAQLPVTPCDFSPRGSLIFKNWATYKVLALFASTLGGLRALLVSSTSCRALWGCFSKKHFCEHFGGVASTFGHFF